MGWVAHKILVSAPVPLELILTGFDWVWAGPWGFGIWDGAWQYQILLSKCRNSPCLEPWYYIFSRYLIFRCTNCLKRCHLHLQKFMMICLQLFHRLFHTVLLHSWLKERDLLRPWRPAQWPQIMSSIPWILLAGLFRSIASQYTNFDCFFVRGMFNKLNSNAWLQYPTHPPHIPFSYPQIKNEDCDISLVSQWEYYVCPSQGHINDEIISEDGQILSILWCPRT